MAGGVARVECAECGVETEWSAEGSNLCSLCQGGLDEDALYVLPPLFDGRVVTISVEDESVEMNQVDGEFSHTVDVETFEDRLDEGKITKKEVDE